jgi:GT2 family glycosyltransferase
LQLSIIIVNYNVKYFLEQCLLSVIKACSNIEAEIFVVDNNSTDGSKEFFNSKFPSVQFIWNVENVGFAKANNRVVQQSSGEYILFLNPDTIVPEDCFEKCLTFIQWQQKPGAMGIRLIDGSGNFLKESKRAFPSPLTSLFKLSGLTALFPHSKIFAKYYLGNLDEHKNHEVDVLVGAFMMIPKAVLQTVGSFDETFFMYGEDIDLSYRIQKAGFKNYYYSEITVIHFKGESTKKGSLNYIRLFYQAMSIFVKKHYSSGSAGLFNALMQIAIFVRAIFSGIGMIFKKISTDFRSLNNKQDVLIVAGEKDYNLLTSSIVKAGLQIKIIARVNNVNAGLLKDYDAEEVVFCEGEISFKEIIDTIQHLPKTVSCQFYAAGSRSIIGSDSKDTGGDCIALDNNA